MLTLLINVLWFICGGFWLGLGWLITGVLFCCTIIGIPFGIASFRIAGFAFFPFGKDIVSSEDAGTCTFLLNVIWIVFAGFWLSLAAIVEGIIFCCTIIGIPFGIGCFKLAKVSFAPLGKRVVSK
ncbi:MAG: YccF domain-containing protein [Kiritimatiellia bacterium]